MKTQALKALTPRRSRTVTTSRAAAQDPLRSLFTRHRENPFVRFLRAAFYYDEEGVRVPARARTISRPYTSL